MKGILVIIVVCLAIAVQAQAPDTLWTRTYGGARTDAAAALVETPDGGFLLAGGTNSFTPSEQVYAVRLNQNGDTLWTRTYGGPNADHANSVHLTPDGGFVLAGYTSSFGSGYQMYVIRTDSNGDTLWTRTYGGPNDEWAYCVDVTSDSGLILTGYSFSYATTSQIYLVRTNSNGDTLWTRNYGGAASDYGYSVRQTMDGGFIVAGRTLSFGPESKAYLIRTDANGDTLWTRLYGGSDFDAALSICETPDEGFAFAAYTYSYSPNALYYLVRTDSLGDTLWTRTYGGSSDNYAYDVQPTADGGFVVAGYSYSFGQNSQIYIVRTKSDGDTLWTKTLGGAGYDECYGVVQTADHDYVVTGRTTSFGSGTQIYAAKLCSDPPPVSGTWTLAGSPYRICENMTIPIGQTLIIEPGVQVWACPGRKIIVNGTLIAQGTEQDSIRFTIAPPDTAGWGGLRFADSAPCSLSYCVIEKASALGTDLNGGGLSFVNADSMLITHSSVRGNHADDPAGHGGGISLLNSGMRMDSIAIEGNTTNSGGGLYAEQSQLTLTHSLVHDNHSASNGGGIWIEGADSQMVSVEAAGTVIEGNSSVAAGGASLNHAALHGVTLRGNSATNYGAAYLHNSALEECIINGNNASAHGGCYLSGGLLRHCTIVGNNGLAFSSGVTLSGADSVENTIIAFNGTEPGAYYEATSTGIVHFSNLFGNIGGAFAGNVPSGTGVIESLNTNGSGCDANFNIMDDPLFADTATQDWHLRCGSPCIDAGIGTDLDDGSPADVGVYHFPHVGAVPLALDSVITGTDSTSEVVHLFWPRAFLTVNGDTLSSVVYRIERSSTWDFTSSQVIATTSDTTFTEPANLGLGFYRVRVINCQ